MFSAVTYRARKARYREEGLKDRKLPVSHAPERALARTGQYKEDRMKSGRYSFSTETLRHTPMPNSRGLPRAVIIALVAIVAVALLSHNVGNAQGTVFTSTAPIRGYY